MILLILVLCLIGCAYVLYATTTTISTPPPSVPPESLTNSPGGSSVVNDNDDRDAPSRTSGNSGGDGNSGNGGGGTKVSNATLPTNMIQNVRFVRAARVNDDSDNDDDDATTVNIVRTGPTLVAIWRELRESVTSFEAVTSDNRWTNLREFQALIGKNTAGKNNSAGGDGSVEMLLANDRSNGHGPTDEFVVKQRRMRQRDREIFMLAHMWNMYTEFEQRNNMMEEENSADEQRRADDRSFSTCLATCMNIFMDATDEEGLAHLAGLIVLYCRTMDMHAVDDARYAELRAVFSVFDPAFIALKWREVKRMCEIARNRADGSGGGGGGGVHLSEYTRREMMYGRRKVVVDNPPECLFELYDRAGKRGVLRIDDDTFHKTDKSFADYELRYIDRGEEHWRLPKTPPLFVQYPTRHFSRVVSSNGVVYDLMSRLDDHDKKGLVCYQPHKTRHRSSDFASFAESMVATTTTTTRLTPLCYVDHAWYEADVTSIVLIDGTRYIFADNASKSATSYMILQVFRAPVNELSDVANIRATDGILSNSKNYSGLALDSDDERLLYPSATTPPSIMTLAYYGIDDDDKRYVLVQTSVEGGVGEYSFDEYNSILLRVPVNARAIVRVQHRRESTTTLDQHAAVPVAVNDGVQNSWLDGARAVWKYPLGDNKNYRRKNENVIASVTVDDDYVIPIANSATRANNFSENAVAIATPSTAPPLA